MTQNRHPGGAARRTAESLVTVITRSEHIIVGIRPSP